MNDAMSASVDALYAAAVGQIAWPVAIDQLAVAVGFTHWSVYAADRHARSAARADARLPATGIWSSRYDPSAQRDYEAEYYKLARIRDYYIQRPDTRVSHDLLYTTEREMDRDPFYDWAEREHGVRYMAVGLTDPGRTISATVGMTRARQHGPMSEAEVARFDRLLDHFERAIELEYRMGHALAPQVDAMDFLDRNPTGIVLLDRRGCVMAANRAARDMAECADAFVLRSDGIAALRSPDDAVLQRLAAQAARTTAGRGFGSGGMVRLPRRSGRRDYVVTVSPLSSRESILSAFLPAVCLLITDPDAPHGKAAAMLRQVYGITPAEQRLVERLLDGDTPEQAARVLSIALPTARTQLAAVFRKTETSRQPELMRLLASLPWWASTES
jgi:DNA-binding CsgD family transcriptional regulator